MLIERWKAFPGFYSPVEEIVPALLGEFILSRKRLFRVCVFVERMQWLSAGCPERCQGNQSAITISPIPLRSPDPPNETILKLLYSDTGDYEEDLLPGSGRTEKTTSIGKNAFVLSISISSK